MKGDKGITLIALIITIIVMLILVTVSLTAGIQSGLFTKAGEAARGTNSAKVAENRISSGIVKIDGVEVDISNYVNNKVNPVASNVESNVESNGL